MRKELFVAHLILAGMFLVPLAYLFQSTSEAAVLPAAFQSQLLIKEIPSLPVFEQIRKLWRPVISTYHVKGRQDLWSLSKKAGVDSFTIRSSNDLDISVFQDGAILKIPNQKGTLYEVETPKSLSVISQGYARGKALGLAYEREILAANGYPIPELKDGSLLFKTGTTLFLPQAFKPTGLHLPFIDMKFRQTSSYGRRRHPVSGSRRMHSGLDLAKPYGSPVLTSRQGVVTFAGWMGGYGNMVEVRHVIKRKTGVRILYTRYGHLSEILVRMGQSVRLYQLIGRVGSTGISTGPHLHFEVRDESGRASNPSNYL